MIVIAIDPGNEESGFVVYDGKEVLDKGKLPNRDLRTSINVWLADETTLAEHEHTEVLIEMVASYGMPVGASVFETCVWIGRFIELVDAWGYEAKLVYRKDVKMHHCNNMRAKDSNIRQALVDKYGKTGTKKNPNPVYNDSTSKMSGDIWSAFAIATMYVESHKTNS